MSEKMQSNYDIQQAIKRILDARTPKIKKTYDSNLGRSLKVTFKNQAITISTEMNSPKINKRGSFR
jgi:hypothetical protein